MTRGQSVKRLMLGAVLGAAIAAPVAVAVLPAQSSTASGSRGQITVTSCAKSAVDMTLRVTNTGSVPLAYQITAYWFQGATQFLALPVTTDAIPPGQALLLPVGNSGDTQDWAAGLTCQAKIVSAS